MANNLFISYDLNSPGQDYSAVIDKIKSLGNWAKVQKSLWYVNSSLTAAEAVELVWAVMDVNDSLIVVNCTNNNAAWKGFSDKVANFIKDKWTK